MHVVLDYKHCKGCCDFIGLNFNLILLEIKLLLSVIDIHIRAGVEQPVSVIFHYLFLRQYRVCFSEEQCSATINFSSSKHTSCTNVVQHSVFLCEHFNLYVKYVINPQERDIFALSFSWPYMEIRLAVDASTSFFNPSVAEFYSLVKNDIGIKVR